LVITGSTFIIDPRVKGQVTLVSEKPLTKEQAFKLLTSTLRLQGYAVVYAMAITKWCRNLTPNCNQVRRSLYR
jgi:general secretion pathway protein D